MQRCRTRRRLQRVEVKNVEVGRDNESCFCDTGGDWKEESARYRKPRRQFSKRRRPVEG